MLNVTARQDLMNKIVETLGVVVEAHALSSKKTKCRRPLWTPRTWR